jgi:hypothetical protein
MEMARERPIAAAAAAAGAAAAGVFLWSRRALIWEVVGNLSDQIGEWTSSMRSDGSGQSGDDFETAGASTGASRNSGTQSRSTGGRSSGSSRRSTRGATGMSETGGGNASLGSQTGGGGMTSSASGRGRAQQAPTS